ncbi:MAG: hypothetical protein HYV20_04340 [Gemmatimonadetes bacterium]|nr:hypothetical protein [Gemmatimonadota bacterium]
MTVVKSVRGVNAWVGGGWVLADALSTDQLREVGFEFEIKVGSGGGGAPGATTCQVPAGSGVTCTISPPAGGGGASRVGRFAAPSGIEVTVDDTVDVDAVYYDANGVPHMYATGLTGQSLDATVAGFAGGKLAGLTKGRTFLRLSYAGLDTYIPVTVVAKPPVFGPGWLSIEMGIERLTGFRYTDPATGATIAGTIQSLPAGAIYWGPDIEPLPVSPYVGLSVGLSEWREDAVTVPTTVMDSTVVVDLRSSALHWGLSAGLSADVIFAEVAWRYRRFPRRRLEREGKPAYSFSLRTRTGGH